MSNLSKLQLWMQENNIDIFIVNRTDEFLGEFIAPYAERLKWISNFSGSAGRTVIKQASATIFIGRALATNISFCLVKPL